MSRPLFNVFEHGNLLPVRFQPTETNCNVGRIYITTGAHFVKNCRDERNAILVIVKDVNYMRGENRLRCNAIIAKPFGELHELDTNGFPELQDARYWIQVALLDRAALDLTVTPKFFDKYLRSPFKVSEYNKRIIPLQQHDEFMAVLKLRQANSSPEGLSIWQRLVVEANKANVPIESLKSLLGRPIQVNAEGFYKRVFHVPDDDKYAVQNFKEISEDMLETRIKEAVFCLKTKGVPNTGQIRSIYKEDDDDELVGLSTERYSYTLKEYAFNTRSPIIGEQKFWLIQDMVKGIKALHDAEFAHRDLSDVTETLLDGSVLKLRQANSTPEGLSIWQRLAVEANKANVPIESLESLFGRPIQVDAEGFFKRVFHVPGDDKYVVQNFKEISEGTLETRIKEAVCCLKTKGVPNTGQIRSIYKDEKDDELVGLSMERYSYTLKEYAFDTRSLITGEQKFWLIHDMVKGIKALHDAGFAHRDLSEVNLMVNSTTETLLDGSTKPELVVIDFGKAEFINRDDVLAWSIGEVANNKLEYLPWIKTVPDHGYKWYRSAATLPRTKNDHAVLQHPINPCSEDMYAVGVLAWRIFSGLAPWGGILDTDLRNLREIVTDPTQIKFYVEKNVNGLKSRELLLKCITATPQERSTARELLGWLLQAKNELISEWAISGRIRKQL